MALRNNNIMLSVAVQLNLHKKGEGDMSEATIQGCINHVVNDYFEKSECLPVVNKTLCDHHGFDFVYKNIIINKASIPHMKSFIIAVCNEINNLHEPFATRPNYTGTFTVKINDTLTPFEVEGEDMPGLTEDEINDAEDEPITINNILTLQNPFEYYLSFFTPETFKTYSLYIISAYIKLSKETQAQKPSSIKHIINRFDKNFPNEEMIDLYNKAFHFPYTITTLHEIVKSLDNHKFERNVNNYLNDLVDYKIRKALEGDYEMMAEAFALTIRNRVFYTDKKLYLFINGHCSEILPCKLNPYVSVFRRLVDGIEKSIADRYTRLGKTKDMKIIETNKHKALKPFSLMTAEVYLITIAKFHLHAELKDGLKEIATAYKDGIVICHQYIKEKKLEIRKIYMEDQIFSTGKSEIYSERNFSLKHPLVMDILQCFKEVFDDDGEVMWFRKCLASLHYKKPERILLIIHGSKGGNAKTKIMETLARVFGPYFLQGSMGIFFENPGATCSPYSAQLEGKVIVNFSDLQFDDKHPISSEIIKAMTGGDSKTAALKCKDARTFAQTAKPFIPCNSPPTFTKIDEPLVERIRILEAKGCYKVDASSDRSLQELDRIYPRIENFWEREGMSDALLWLIINDWDLYVKEGLAPTKMQKDNMEKWRTVSCPVDRFLKEQTEDRGTKNFLYTETELYTAYTKFMKAKNIKDILMRMDFVAKLKTLRTPEKLRVSYYRSNPNQTGTIEIVEELEIYKCSLTNITTSEVLITHYRIVEGNTQHGETAIAEGASVGTSVAD
jgi:phage/plasmid-associated DNA primase